LAGARWSLRAFSTRIALAGQDCGRRLKLPDFASAAISGNVFGYNLALEKR